MTAASETPPDWATLRRLCAPHGLRPVGGFVAAEGDPVPHGTRVVVLLAPEDAAFWPLFSASPEYLDGGPDPLDRWSRRVIGTLACGLGAKALFPFGGPPWRPFIAWALRTGRIHSSPVGLLVEPSSGLFISLRGALALKAEISLPPAAPSPCETCAERPCLTACPVAALTAHGYDTTACRAHIATDAGSACVDRGCAVRRACPVSSEAGRSDAQSAFHMRAFGNSP